MSSNPKKVMIVGASSGIGAALAIEMAERGYQVLITGRRTEKLAAVRTQLKGSGHQFLQMDVSNYDQAYNVFLAGIEAMGGLDILVLNAGIGDSAAGRETSVRILNTNVTGFVNLAEAAMSYFIKQNGSKGHIVGISSVAGTRGARVGNVYGASKRCVTHYMDGLKHYVTKKRPNIKITDIRPGFIDTPMTEDNKGMFWVISAEKSVKYMANAIAAKKKVAYVPRRWILVAWLWKLVPGFIYNRT